MTRVFNDISLIKPIHAVHIYLFIFWFFFFVEKQATAFSMRKSVLCAYYVHNAYETHFIHNSTIICLDTSNIVKSRVSVFISPEVMNDCYCTDFKAYMAHIKSTRKKTNSSTNNKNKTKNAMKNCHPLQLCSLIWINTRYVAY